MDGMAIKQSKDADLEQVGLLKKGDILAVKAFCDETGLTQSKEDRDKDHKKRKLLAEFLHTSGGKKNDKKKKPAKEISKEKPEKKKKIQLGWKHHNNATRKYETVHLRYGGGTRSLDLPLSNDRLDIISAGSSVYFPNNECMYGNISNMRISLGDYTGKEITSENFSLENYIETRKLDKVKLFILTKEYEVDTSSDEDSDYLLENPVFQNDASKRCTSESKDLKQANDNVSKNVSDSILKLDEKDDGDDNLMGSTKERESLKEQQNKEFMESLKADQSKERRRKLMQARADMVPKEAKDGIKVSVRHLSLGNITYSFEPSCTCYDVHNWVGSMSMTPEHFVLSTHSKKVDPSQSVTSLWNTMLYMTEKEECSPYPGDDIYFLGYGPSNSKDQDETIVIEDKQAAIPETVSSHVDDHHFECYYGSLLARVPSRESYSDEDEGSVQPTEVKEQRTVKDVLDDLAEGLNLGPLAKVSTFNISRSHIWEGAKRALSRKKFTPKNKVDVKFTDDSGKSEGAVDDGGPMREFFTLAIQWIETHMFYGEEGKKFMSFQVKFYEENDYFFAGMIIALSLVHGGPGPQFFASQMYDVLLGKKVNVSINHIIDMELKSLLQDLLNSTSTDTAQKLLDDHTLSTLLYLAGTFTPIKELSDVAKMVQSTVNWYVLCRPSPAIESFKSGLGTLGVMSAIQANPDAFRSVFFGDEDITADKIQSLFVPLTSPLGSNKFEIESLVLSRWNDYLQDIEDGEEHGICLRDILFFATGCKSIPPRHIHPSLDFLHGGEDRFPKANTCAAVLRLPVCHTNYESFKADMSFGILNGQGFGCA